MEEFGLETGNRFYILDIPVAETFFGFESDSLTRTGCIEEYEIE